MIAMVCHAANRAWCQANGDDSQKSWDAAEDWQRASAIAGVMFRIDNPSSGDDAQHNAWMADKVQDGWVYGDVKDGDKKTHPCLVPFNQLPEFQKKKDALFCATVDALLPSIDTGTRSLTFGERAVGLNFNHATGNTHDQVHENKVAIAKVIDIIGDPSADEVRRSYMYNILRTAAINGLIAANMAVTKLLTWKD